MSSRGLVETFIGFDSAWTNNKTKPGAISSVTMADGCVRSFISPKLVSFEEAADLVITLSDESDYTLIAIDQPTIVPNMDRGRPVERVARSVMSRIRGAVQPANRGRIEMFGDHAPIWRFLDQLRMRQNPAAARKEAKGRFLIEVFPALALTVIASETWERRRAAKYNPINKLFRLDDWNMIVNSIARVFDELEMNETISTADCMKNSFQRPRKRDQDQLDSLLCLLIAIQWRHAPQDRCVVIGDSESGYMVTPVTRSVREVLADGAKRFEVPLNGSWDADASHLAVPPRGPS